MSTTELDEVGRSSSTRATQWPRDSLAQVRGRLPDALPDVSALVAVACAVVAVVAVAWLPANGIDPTDEASYLQAVQAPHRTDAFNGFFGLYLRPLWILTGWNIAAVRLVGLAVLVGVAIVLGVSVARFIDAPRVLVTATTVAAATSYYATSWRTPSYNWLALVGAALVAAGSLRVVTGSSERWGLVVGLGAAVSAAGKLPTAGLLLVLAAATLRRHRSALLLAVAVLAVTVAVHLTLVLPPAETLHVIRRSAAVLAAVNPTSYTASGAVFALSVQLLMAVALGLIGGGLFGLLTCAVFRRGHERMRWYRRLTLGGTLAACVTALATSTWAGGMSNLGFGAGCLPALVALLLALVVGFATGLAERSAARRPVRAALLLLGGVVAVVFGSNLSIHWQLTIAGLLLVPACLVVCAAFPRALQGPLLVTVALALAAGSAVVAIQTRFDVRRSASWSVSTVPVSMGRITTRTDAATAAQLSELRMAAERQGWRPGTRLVDATFSPAVPLVMGATVPPVLLPGFPAYGLASVCRAVQGLGAQWQDAWLLLPTTMKPKDARQITGYLGLRYPQDYVQVTTFEPRFSDLHGRLLRPKPQAMSAGATQSLGCLGEQPDR
jgi:hypothetical protein